MIVGTVVLGMFVAVVVGFATERGLITALAALGAVSLIFGVLFTLVGMPLLVLGVLFIALALRASRRSPGRKNLAAAASGVVFGVAFAFLAIAGSHSPIIDCSTNTLSVGYWYWPGGPSSSSGSGSSSPSGEHRGSVTFAGRTYEYECAGSALTTFRRAA